MFDLDFLIDMAFSTPGIHMSAATPLITERERERSVFGFQYSSKPLAESEGKQSIWTKEYEPSSLVHIQKAAATFPHGGEKGFRQWLKSRMMIAPEHSYNHHHGVDAIWQFFARTFRVIGSILFYEPIFRPCLRRMLTELANDGIRYIDFRAAFIFNYRREGCEEPEQDYVEFFRVFKDEIEKFKATEAGKRFYGARMIWTTLRIQSNRQIIDNMKQCIIAKQAYPDMVCGFDLVGQEDAGRPLVDLVPVLFWFRKLCAEEQVELPFFFHAGECLGDGDETDHNLFDAILLGTRRIGHGYSLYKHPLLIDLVKEKKILVESCPISNEILRLASSIKQHSLPALLSRGVSVSLCNDDPAVLGHGKNGLTHDFWQALQGLENTGLSGLATMAENSIRWSCFEDQTSAEWQSDIRQGITGKGLKAKRLQEWYADFEQFCQWVVLEFAEDVDDAE
jgi:adenosine deaminase CECR1